MSIDQPASTRSSDKSWSEGLEILWQDADRVFHRGSKLLHDGSSLAVLAVAPPAHAVVHDLPERLAHEFGFREHLQEAWAVVPVEFAREDGVLFFHDPGGEPLARLLSAETPVEALLRKAIGLAEAVSQMHGHGVLHKDIKPSNVLFDRSTGSVRLTGFGIARRMARGQTEVASAEIIAGTFAYMAPEQTGRMNRAVDVRSDLYSLGVTLYELMTGTLPFQAQDPAEWIHCHLAKQAVPPSEARAELPAQLSAVVMKLLSKAPETRYQSASGLKADLIRCLHEWETLHRISMFPLGEHDGSTQLEFRQELYGRQAEVAQLTSAFEGVVRTGERHLALVSGYSGVGKSSLVNELRKVVASANGLFAAGKFDQYKRDIPYATLAEAFRALVRDLLGRADEELASWREAMKVALDANGQLMVHLVPEIELLIGKQPPVPELSGAEARNRFIQLFTRFVGVFARRDRPLVLFLDDLQWLDAATLDVFEALAIQPGTHHLLLVGAYRSNEVDETHRLHRCLGSVRRASPNLTDLALDGIGMQDVAAMVADAVRCVDEEASTLARCLFEKTGGNPFFAVQFARSLVEAGLLRFEEPESRWRWDLERIRAQQVSDNVVDLMIERLLRLPPGVLSAVHTMACVGNRVDRAALCVILQDTEPAIHARLEDALHSGLLLELADGYAFAHDRIQEAAYAMLTADERAAAHLLIGRLLLEAADERELDAQIFDVVTHFNQATTLATSPEEREANARLNLRAGRKARASAAYGAACDYLAFGRAQLGEDGWLRLHELSFELGLELAECTFLRGHLAETREMVHRLLSAANKTIEVAAAYRLKVELHVVSAENDEAVVSGLLALRQLGIDLPLHPTREEVEREYGRVWINLNGRSIDAIADLPPMVDPEKLAAMRLLAELWPPTYFTEFNLTVMVICHMVNLSLMHGSSPSSNQGFALLGWLMGPVFDRFEQGHRLTRLACDLAATRNAPLDYGRICVTMGLTSSWTEPLSVAIDWFHLARREAIKSGDVYFACYCGYLGVSQQLIRGHDLAESLVEARDRLEFAAESGFQDGMAVTATVERTMSCLLGQTRGLTDFSDDSFDGGAFEAAVAASGLSVLRQWYWTRKTMLFFLARDAEAALAAAARVDTGPWTRVVQIEYMDYHYFSALAICALLPETDEQEQPALRASLAAHRKTIEEWARDTASPTFADKPLLVEAEIARIEGRVVEAEQLYEQAVRVAHRNGTVHCEALANELAAGFYRERGLDRVADAYLRFALECYSRWGARAKVRQLVSAHPNLRGVVQHSHGGGTTTTQVQQIDLASVLKSSKAVSGELVLDQLLTTLMRTVVELAGAQRAVLLIPDGERLEAEAEAVTASESVVVRLRQDLASMSGLPSTIVRFVARTGESVVVDDAFADSRFEHDSYVTQNRVRSMMCLPVTSHGDLQAVLYLENNLAPRVFTQAHLDVLGLLAGQAAISLENARLYADLEAREAKIRRIFDSNVIGIVFWDLNGQLLDANEAFLRMVGYDREELERGSMRWIDMTPPEWQDQVRRELQELYETGELRPIEKEYFHKDGTRVPVLLGAAVFEGLPQQGVAIIVDLRKQKEAEARAVEIERRYRLLHAELAHANRVATIGQLSTWIAHDVKQPLAGIVTSGNAGLRWLAANPPNIEAAERNLRRMVDDGMRAADILDKTRALARKASPKAEAIDINSIIQETLALVAPEAERKSITVRTRLGDPPLFANADRTQIQQVVLNLVVNAMEAMSTEPMQHPRELLVVSEVDPGEGVAVSVLDTGHGLPASRINACFDAFYTTKPEGLGMGLAICRSIIDSFEGRISAAPNTPRGAIFRFVLPMAESGAAPAELLA